MGAALLQFAHDLYPITCGECGIQFAIPNDYDDRRRQDGKVFYCPNQHARVYRDTEAKRLRRELEDQKRQTEFQREQRQLADRQLIAAKGQMTKLKKRVACGVCPACNRSFTNLRQHMKGKHPDYSAV